MRQRVGLALLGLVSVSGFFRWLLGPGELTGVGPRGTGMGVTLSAAGLGLKLDEPPPYSWLYAGLGFQVDTLRFFPLVESITCRVDAVVKSSHAGTIRGLDPMPAILKNPKCVTDYLDSQAGFDPDGIEAEHARETKRMLLSGRTTSTRYAINWWAFPWLLNALCRGQLFYLLVVLALPCGLILASWRRPRNQCPSCGYDLRGLSHPVCPECGYSIDRYTLSE